ncbi:MAG: MOSC domain-containing protein [Acidobacteriota bacterium]|nr:MAG: MOSC domain-containing protein [Acidobacteriota bacterium]
MKISEINIYPIKSLKGITLESSTVERRGLEFDRRWMIVDAAGKFLTQRQEPKMATITVEVTNVGLQVTSENGSSMNVSKPGDDDSRILTKVWGSESEAFECDVEANEWFSDVLSREVRLLYMPDDAGRPINERFNRGGELVSFADGYPLLITAEPSLAMLNQKIAETTNAGRLPAPQMLPMRRFRPNLVVSGSDAFAEDDWKRIRVGNAVLRVTKPCARCVMTTVDPECGKFDAKEPLKTLASFRMARDVMPERLDTLGLEPTAVFFGMNLVPETTGVEIRVGDEVEILESF